MNQLLVAIMLLAASSAMAQTENANEETKPMAAKPAEKPASKQTQKRRFRFGVFALYNTANTIKEKGSNTYLGTEYSFGADEKTTGAPGFGISLERRFDPEWGMDFGIAYELTRTIESYSGTIAGVSASGDYADPKPEFTVIYAFFNGRYYPSDELYVLGGLNLSKADVKNSDVNLQSLIGWQFGVGYQFTPHISAEAIYRSLRMKGDASTDLAGNPLKINYDSFELNGASLMLRYTF